ncbi:uncharacterized protein METZ01_LOCUS90522, partial [marine metagenome]
FGTLCIRAPHHLPPGRHHDHRDYPEAARSDRRRHRHPVDDEPLPVFRPPDQRRRRGQRVPVSSEVQAAGYGPRHVHLL